MRVALVNPPDPAVGLESRLTPPLGLGYVASFAGEHGYAVDVIDLVADFGISPDRLAETGLLDGYDVIGFSTYTEAFRETMRIVRLVKQSSPTSRIVLGGYHASLLPQRVMEDFPEVDTIVLREGERAFTDLLRAVESGCRSPQVSGTWTRCSDGTPQLVSPNFDELDQATLPYPQLRTRYQSAPYAGRLNAKARRYDRVLYMVSSRGCPKKCSFCAIIVLSPRWRARTVDDLMAEVRYRYAQEPFQHISFQDANFFVDFRRTVAFAEALHAFNPHVTWSGTATADHIIKHKDVLRHIASLNCAYLEVGIESGNDASLSRFNKWTSATMNGEVLDLLNAVHMPVGLDFIMFEPESSLIELTENYRFLMRHELGGYWPADALFSSLKLYPGTPVRDRYESEHSLTLPVHDIPRVGFQDPVVAVFARWCDLYLERYQSATDALVQDIERLTVAADASSLVQELVIWGIRLRHLPYRFFESVLANARKVLDTSATWADVEEACDLRAHAQTQDSARRQLAKLLGTFGPELGLSTGGVHA